MQFTIIGLDGLPICFDYNTETEAKEGFLEWSKQYEHQEYYSTARLQRILPADLHKHCKIISYDKKFISRDKAHSDITSTLKIEDLLTMNEEEDNDSYSLHEFAYTAEKCDRWASETKEYTCIYSQTIAKPLEI